MEKENKPEDAPKLPSVPEKAVESSNTKPDKLINGKCTTCAGLTYFSHVMSQNRSKPICIGYRQKRDVPPIMIDVEAEAKKQVNPSVYDDSSFYFIGAGMTIYTPKMEQDGWAPLSKSIIDADDDVNHH
jgi:hypothetical protein